MACNLAGLPTSGASAQAVGVSGGSCRMAPGELLAAQAGCGAGLPATGHEGRNVGRGARQAQGEAMSAQAGAMAQHRAIVKWRGWHEAGRWHRLGREPPSWRDSGRGGGRGVQPVEFSPKVIRLGKKGCFPAQFFKKILLCVAGVEANSCADLLRG